MRLNKNHQRNKTHIIGGFKIPYSLNGPSYNREKWVNENDTKKVEEITGGLFVKYLREVEKRNVFYSSPNPDDDHKNPDIFIHMDGRIHSVQITQIVLNDYLSKLNQTRNLCEKISKSISNIYTPPIKINVQIYPPWVSEEPPKFPSKIYSKLSKVIGSSILENIEELKTKQEYLNFNLEKKVFGSVADSYNLYPIPIKYQSNFFGENNIYVEYEFDDIKISITDIEKACDKVFIDKNEGNSEILLIWGDRNHFLNTEALIRENLINRFKNTSLKSVYFLAFSNILNEKKRHIISEKII